MAAVRRQIRAIAIPGVSAAIPGQGSLTAPVMIVGQSLCKRCLEEEMPFTGGTGRCLDRALKAAGRDKADVFVTNAVHFHPPNNAPSKASWLRECLPFLRAELEIIAPQLVICWGVDAERSVRQIYPAAPELPWPFKPPRGEAFPDERTWLTFAPHPGGFNRTKPPELGRLRRAQFEPSLADAIRWAFHRDAAHRGQGVGAGQRL